MDAAEDYDQNSYSHLNSHLHSHSNELNRSRHSHTTNDTDDYEYDYDYDDESSINTVEDYQQLKVVVGKRNGIVTLMEDIQNGELGSGSGVEEKVGDDEDHENDVDENEEEEKAFDVEPDLGHEDGIHGNIPTRDRDSPTPTPNANESPLSPPLSPSASTSMPTSASSSASSSAFQLIPTTNQTHKDHQQKEHLETRTVCLEAAAEAYKCASLEVPDVSCNVLMLMLMLMLMLILQQLHSDLLN